MSDNSIHGGSFVSSAFLVALICLVSQGTAKAEADILSAITPGIAMVTRALEDARIAKTQANTDLKITAMNNATSLAQTEIVADTTKFTAQTNAAVSFAQAIASMVVNSTNQTGMTTRLAMQLAEMRAQSQDAAESARQNELIKFKYQMALLDLQRKNGEAQIKLQEAQNAQALTAAGNISGFKNLDSGSALTVTPIGGGNSVVASNTPSYSSAIQPTQVATATSGGGRGSVSANLQTNRIGRAVASEGNPSSQKTGASPAAGAIIPRNETSRRLLAAANQSSPTPSLPGLRTQTFTSQNSGKAMTVARLDSGAGTPLAAGTQRGFARGGAKVSVKTSFRPQSVASVSDSSLGRSSLGRGLSAGHGSGGEISGRGNWSHASSGTSARAVNPFEGAE